MAVHCDGEIPRENPGCPIAHHNLPIDGEIKLRMKIVCGQVPMLWDNGSSFLAFVEQILMKSKNCAVVAVCCCCCSSLK
jgi:hypothetical protein